MPWFTRISRFADVHSVYTQKADNSCGIASVMMCVFKVNKLTPGATSVYKEQEVYDAYSKIVGFTYDGSAYSFATKLDQTLNTLGCGKWKAQCVAKTAVSDFLIDHCGDSGFGPTLYAPPVIMLVAWTKGAHFVVVDSVRKVMGTTYITICDPWDGQLRVTSIARGKQVGYTTDDTWEWNLEGTPEHSYSGVQSGVANGWVVHQTD